MKKRERPPAHVIRQCHEEVFHICPLCFGREESLALQVHHINSINEDHRPSNLIALCLVCHAKATGRSIKECDLQEIKKELRQREPPIDAFNRLVLKQPTHRIHNRFAGEGHGSHSHLRQAISLIEFGGRSLSLDDHQRVEALLKLIHIERKYGGPYHIGRAERYLRKAGKLAVSMPDLQGQMLYEAGYIRHLKNDLQAGLKLLKESENSTIDNFTRAHIRIVRLSIPMIVVETCFNEKEFHDYADLLQDWDLILYQNAVQHLIRKYLLEHKLDKAQEMIARYEKINQKSDVRTEEKTVPDYFRGRILLMAGEFDEATKLLKSALDRRIQFGSIEGISELMAFLGEAYEGLARESGDGRLEDKAMKQYEAGIKRGPLMANEVGYRLCQEKRHDLSKKRNRRKSFTASNPSLQPTPGNDVDFPATPRRRG